MFKKHLALALLATISSTVSYAAENQKPSTESGTRPQVSTETRQKMATLHEKMAACLRSDKTIQECRTEMRDSCHAMLGKDMCPMLRSMWTGGAVSGTRSNGSEMNSSSEE
jgi:hypothetical protein